MRNAQREPTLIEDIGAIAGLYGGVFRMMTRRWNPRAHQPTLPVLPEELCPPPLPESQEEKPAQRELVGHR
jgi:hypothetical protein